jgi:hypothetical protein
MTPAQLEQIGLPEDASEDDIDQPARHLPADKGNAWLTLSVVNPGTTVGASGADRAQMR